MHPILSACCVICLSGAAVAQPVPNYGFDWCTIGDPGNAAAEPGAPFTFLIEPVGRVDYTYRLTRTEVTNTQWLEFVDAYSRFHYDPLVINDLAFSGPDNYRTTNDPTNFGWYTMPGGENAPARFSWFYAARFCNWLHNGKAMAPWAFESGAYTMSAYHIGPDGQWTGPVGHAAGALFWIPTVDEWTKGMYYDPNKNGPGQAGYWLHPAQSDVPLVGGPPGTPGAQTSAGDWSAPWPGFVPVGSYPESQSPWGLLDGSGGVMEYNESSHYLWVTHGSETRMGANWAADRLDLLRGTVPWTDEAGFRIASVVPSPGTIVALTALCLFVQVGRRRHVKSDDSSAGRGDQSRSQHQS